MERIAFIMGETFIYWSSIITVLGAVTAILVFVALYLGKSGNWFGAAVAVPVTFAISMACARLVHWYCRETSYPSFLSAMTDYSSGGYALTGVFIGCLLAVGVLWLIFAVRNLPEMLDAMAIAGCGGVAVGRLASLFNTSDRGMLLEGITQLPFASEMINSVSAETEYRLATFMLQSITAGIIFAIMLVFYLVQMRRKERYKDGDACLLTLCMYGACQIVLDSTRYDSLFLRSNGFVSLVQIASAVALVVPIVLFSIRMVRARKWKYWYLGLWTGMLGLIGCAGFMEYYVQRYPNKAGLAYTVMSICLVVTVILTVLVRGLAVSAERKKMLEEQMCAE